MKHNGWLTRSVLWICLAAAGCDSQADHEGDGLATQDGELEGPGRREKPAKSEPGGDPADDEDCGPVHPQDPGDATNPCAALLCPQDSHCEVQDVVCVRAPCPPIAACVPISGEPAEDAGAGPLARCATVLCRAGTQCVETDEGAQCVPLTTCAATLCKTGTTCIETPNGAECVEPSSCAATTCPVGHDCVETPNGAECVAPASCAATLCEVGTTCVETPTGAECVPTKSTCDNVRCKRGTHCELQEVQCIRAPCPAQPICVPDVDACATVRCRAGTHCELKEVQCVRAPCDPIAECVAD